MTVQAPWLDVAETLKGRVSDGPSILPLAEYIGNIYPKMKSYTALVKPDTPWCGLFIAYCLAKVGIEPRYDPSEDTNSFLWAYDWTRFGISVPIGQQRPGDIAVLRMASGYHVTFFYAKNEDGTWACLGGNQGDQAKISNYNPKNVIAVRRPAPASLPPAANIPAPPLPATTSRFAQCIPLLLKSEGGNDDDPRDPGGRTSRGILQREWDKWRQTHPGLPQDVWQAPQDQILAIYREEYWDVLRCDELPPGVDYAVFDEGVLEGVGHVARSLQTIVGTDQDGEIGPLTIAATRALDPEITISKLCDARMAYLRGRKGWPTYGRGWTNRVNDVCKDALKMVTNIVPPEPEPTPMPDTSFDPAKLTAELAALNAKFAKLLEVLTNPQAPVVKPEPVPAPAPAPAPSTSGMTFDLRTALAGLAAAFGLTASGVMGAPMGETATLAGALVPLLTVGLSALGVPSAVVPVIGSVLQWVGKAASSVGQTQAQESTK